MPQPQAYERLTDFSERDGDDTDHPALNQELDQAAQSINQIRANLAQIQRDDGALKNGVVTADSLAPSAFDAVLINVNEAVGQAQDAATSALTSATTANTARDQAVASAAAALTSQTASGLNAATASAAATTATGAQAAVAASAAAALDSANNADTSEAAALASQTAAAASAAAALADKNAAAASAAAALASEGNADASEAAAAASAAAAAASYDSFDDRYLGAKAVAPALDNDGNALINGAIYFDTVIGGGSWRAWNAGAWVTLPAATAATVANTPAGNIAATTVQAAINELDAEKASIAVAPAGEIRFFPATVAPAGFLKANGALLSRTSYAALWAYAQASGNISANDGAWQSGGFSPGDGATTFRIPDARGYHMRAFDDGRGIDSGRAIGSVQADATLTHGHSVSDGGHAHGVYDPGHSHGPAGASSFVIANAPGSSNFQVIAGASFAAVGTSNSTGAVGTSVSIYAAGTGLTVNNYVGGNETRVKTLAILACIKY